MYMYYFIEATNGIGIPAIILNQFKIEQYPKIYLRNNPLE
jgi:hypothetical protein